MGERSDQAAAAVWTREQWDRYRRARLTMSEREGGVSVETAMERWYPIGRSAVIAEAAQRGVEVTDRGALWFGETRHLRNWGRAAVWFASDVDALVEHFAAMGELTAEARERIAIGRPAEEIEEAIARAEDQLDEPAGDTAGHGKGARING